MPSPKKCIGFIFKAHRVYCDGQYYAEFLAGIVHNKEDAHVYTCAEAQQLESKYPGWASKEAGKWVAVYE